jgi:hypothetical protein
VIYLGTWETLGRETERRHTVEGSLVGDIIHQQDTHCSTIVCRGDGSEPLLASRVPNLKFNSLSIQLDCADLKVDSDRSDEARRE